jgi:Family of unknown function (DUF6364)
LIASAVTWRSVWAVCFSLSIVSVSLYTFIRTAYYTCMRKKLTLSVDENLIREMKIQALKENRDVSDIVEELFKEYLKRSKAKK